MRLALSSLLLVAACGFGKFTPNPEYCGYSDGDAYCERTTPDKPYCIVGRQSCLDAAGIDASDPYGCVAQLPAPECRDQCGQDNADMCLDPTDPSSSSTTEDETDSSTTEDPTADTETDESSSSTGLECMNNDACTDPAAPYCLDGTCVPCSGALDGDLACAELDPTRPLCVDDACVQCTAENASACEGTTPLCGDAGMCVGCEFHEQCEALGSPACDFTDGSCFDPANAEDVNLATPGALAAAVGAVEDGEHVALLITGSTGSTHSATIDGGKVIAIVSADGDAQNIQGAGASSILTVNGPGSTAILHRVVLQGSSARGIDVTTGGTLYADATQVAQNTGGGITLAAGTSGFLRNCMIARNGDQFSATTGIDNSGTLEVLYTSIVANDGNGSDSIECSGGSTTIRNSIAIGSNADSIDCSGLDASNSAFDEAVTGNDDVGALDPMWFTGIATGDVHLSTMGGPVFMGIAQWEDGDPPFDFDGNDRPSTDGTADFAGADVP